MIKIEHIVQKCNDDFAGPTVTLLYLKLSRLVFTYVRMKSRSEGINTSKGRGEENTECAQHETFGGIEDVRITCNEDSKLFTPNTFA